MNGRNPPDDPLDDSNTRCRHLGDWLIEGFLNISRKIHQTNWKSPLAASSTLSVDQDNSELKEVIYDRIHSSLLPLLQHQITTLSLLLAGLSKEPESGLKQMLAIQPEIDYNLTQIKAALDVVCPRGLSSLNQADDQQLKQFKTYRLVELREMLWLLAAVYICSALDEASRHIGRMGFSTSSRPQNRLSSTYRKATPDALDWIGFTIKHLRGSELDVAENRWRYAVLSIDKELDNLICLVNPTAHSTNQGFPLAREPVILLAKSAIPIIKLSKLFFTKLSRAGMNRKLVSSSTDMNSIQLGCLCKSAEKVSEDLPKLLTLLSEADVLDGAAANFDNSQNIIRLAATVASHFETPVQLAVDYLVPLVPETGGLPNKNYYKDWLLTWKIQSILAIHNFIQRALTI
ncbi:hypothetical protein PtA15_6A345 [Puccinia triticina]|uniref:Uncharacterized protein n=1 Tax=Puccinia triticina TaxID=208348 RepID=A0ABY7CKG7_9BASI|nr:uncharacterized protein PtA15_6A345 [Puccinia triticina]WAQ85716.1 hypothetical protein PtA15_6A345 [Puccinia triticina]